MITITTINFLINLKTYKRIIIRLIHVSHAWNNWNPPIEYLRHGINKLQIACTWPIRTPQIASSSFLNSNDKYMSNVRFTIFATTLLQFIHVWVVSGGPIWFYEPTITKLLRVKVLTKILVIVFSFNIIAKKKKKKSQLPKKNNASGRSDENW